MILPHDTGGGGWVNAKYELHGFLFAASNEEFHEKMCGLICTITKKEPVTLCGFDGFWYTFEAEERSPSF